MSDLFDFHIKAKSKNKSNFKGISVDKHGFKLESNVIYYSFFDTVEAAVRIQKILFELFGHESEFKVAKLSDNKWRIS